MLILIFVIFSLVIVALLLTLVICGSDVCFKELDEIDSMIIENNYDGLYHKYNEREPSENEQINSENGK